jgi:CHAT domain-containing protein
MPLGQTENEVLAIGEAYLRMGIPVTILTGCEAIEERLIELQRTDQLPRYTCLHFATHATDVQGDTPMESHVFLRNSRLEGLEIATWRLNADLVVLSACHSGQRAIAGRGMDELPGDELFGLQAAFFAAGARCVVGNLWPVDDVVSSHMMIRFHQYLLEGQPPECALQKAVLDHLQESTCLTRKVFFWAPFFIAGMGRAVSADTSSAVH